MFIGGETYKKLSKQWWNNQTSKKYEPFIGSLKDVENYKKDVVGQWIEEGAELIKDYKDRRRGK